VWLYVRLFENFVFETRAAALDFDAMLGLCKLLLGLVVRSHFAMCSARPVPGSPTDSRAGKSEGLFILNAVRNGGVGGVGGAKRKNESERSKTLPRKLAADGEEREERERRERAHREAMGGKEPPGKLSKGNARCCPFSLSVKEVSFLVDGLQALPTAPLAVSPQRTPQSQPPCAKN
jgi:hypothetical protein